MAIKKCIAMRLGVIYDSQMTNRKQRGLRVRDLKSLLHSYWRLGVYDSQSAAMHKNYHKQVEALEF